MKTPLATLCLFLLAVASTSTLVGAEHRPYLNQIHSPELTQALTSPEAFWQFVTAPETAYSNRMGAAAQCVGVFPVNWLPRLLAAQAELDKEQGLHAWALKPHPGNSAIMPREPSIDRFLRSGLPRERKVLGHSWVVPDKSMPYPITWEDESSAPWPWQVQKALDQLYSTLCPNSPDELSRAPAWLEEALQLPWGTDEEAQTFVRVSRDSCHLKSMAVMARWRKIALDPSKPKAAWSVAAEFAQAVRLWGDPDSQMVGQVLLVDIIASSPHEAAKQQAATYVGDRRDWSEKDGTPRPALPITSILTVSRVATDPTWGDEWKRLYLYVTGVCRALDGRMDNYYSRLPEGPFQTGKRWNQPPLDPNVIYHL